MELAFHKYQATGNDFIIFDGRKAEVPETPEFCSAICDRRFGVGADGVIIVRPGLKHSFDVIYYNPDGSASLCGNGTRAAVKFARRLGLFSSRSVTFNAFDGEHEAKLLDDGRVRLKMADVHSVRSMPNGTFVDTGSPHLVCFVDDVEKVNVKEEGRKLRHETPVASGVNVNFVQREDIGTLRIRTYERGVEGETLSCGTGVTAAALVSGAGKSDGPVRIQTAGGDLEVDFEGSADSGFHNVTLTGPAEEVYRGFYTFKQ